MSSAANIIPPEAEAGGQEGSPKARPNPVVLEVPVNATGTRPSDTGARDLFSEETTTVLVFKDGAVIRLAAAVTAGQLLFLTNKNSNQEVVCQVLHKRSYKPTACYVELQFTEARADFWGVAFPAENAGGNELKAAEMEAEETMEDVPRMAVAPHNPEDVDQLKKEVEALREQLLTLEKKNAAEAAAKAAEESSKLKGGGEEKGEEKSEQKSLTQSSQRDAEGAEKSEPRAHAQTTSVGQQASSDAAGLDRDRLRTASEGGPYEEKPRSGDATAPDLRVTKAKLELASVTDQSPEPAKAAQVVAAPLMPAAPEKKEAARPVVGMKLPVWKSEKSPEQQLLEEQAAMGGKVAKAPTKEPPEELLPKPALDFSQVPGNAARREENDPNSIYKYMDPKFERNRIVGMSVLLVLLLAGGAWYGKWWQYLPKRKQAVEVAPANLAKKPNAVQSAPVASANAAEKTVGAAGKPAATTANASVAVNKEGKDAGEAAVAAENKNEDATAETKSVERAVRTAEKKPVVARERAAGRGASKKSGAESAAAEPSPAEAVASDAPLIPAKLLKAATPVYPPDAMRSYITGDVRAEVVVDATGHVREVKVISGPRALREAAVEALKKYEYEPGTQGGKAVETKATVTVKFWFNP